MRNDVIIEKMIDIIEKLQSYIGENDYKTFSENDMLVDASVFNLSQLREVANRIDSEFEAAHPEIPWRQIYGLRNRVIHDYEGINLNLIWEIITEDLPVLLVKLKKINT